MKSGLRALRIGRVLVRYRLDDLSLLLLREVWPSRCEIPGLFENLLPRSGSDAEDIEFGLEPRQLFFELDPPRGQRTVPATEVLN